MTAAASAFRQKPEPIDGDGNTTGEELFNIEPKSLLVLGSLQQFKVSTSINEGKLRSFELFRRNTRHPEIMTFDELFQRARYIVGDADEGEI